MTPLDIEVLLHYHCCPRAHPRSESPAVGNVTNNLCSDGLITSNGEKGVFTTTERGKALVAMLCDTPYPKKEYIDPRNGKPVKPS